jgi:hypothetical protein
VRRAWRFWLALTSRRERGTTLALFRIAVGTVTFVSLVSAMWSGVIDALWIDVEHGGMRPVGGSFFLLEWLGGPRPGVVWPVTIAATLFSAAMVLGLGGRATVFLAALAYRSVSYGSGGYDSMISNAAWLIFLADSTATLSLDCRIREGRFTSEREVPAWPRFLAIGQLVLIYTATGLQKSSASWTFADGYSALYWFLQDPTWIRFDTSWTADVYPLTQVMTFAVWHFEVTASLLLLVLYFRDDPTRPGRIRGLFNRRDLRVPWAMFGVGMHLGIALLLDMGPFSWISLAFYLCLLHPDEIAAAARRAATVLDWSALQRT